MKKSTFNNCKYNSFNCGIFFQLIGLKIGDKYLVTGAFEEEWLFMLIPTITFVLMLVTKMLEGIYI